MRVTQLEARRRAAPRISATGQARRQRQGEAALRAHVHSRAYTATYTAAPRTAWYTVQYTARTTQCVLRGTQSHYTVRPRTAYHAARLCATQYDHAPRNTHYVTQHATVCYTVLHWIRIGSPSHTALCTTQSAPDCATQPRTVYYTVGCAQRSTPAQRRAPRPAQRDHCVDCVPPSATTSADQRSAARPAPRLHRGLRTTSA